MAVISLVRKVVVGAALLAAVSGCSSEAERQDAASGQTPPPAVSEQRAVLVPGQGGWDSPPVASVESASVAGLPAQATGAPLLPRPLTPADQASALGPGVQEAAATMAPAARAAMDDHSPALAPVMGIGAGASTEARLSALEGQVSDLRKEFSSMLPSIRALIAERDASSLPSAHDAGAASIAVKQAPSGASSGQGGGASPTPYKAPVDVAPAAGGARAVSDLRVGVHPGKTRIVLDVSAPVEPRHDLDNAEKLFILDLPGTIWKPEMQKTLPASSLLASYTAQPSSDGKGTTVAFQLRNAVKILSSIQLKPAEGKGHRVVIDLGVE